MGEINLASTLGQIDSPVIKDRSQGLADLTRILRHNQRSLRSGVLDGISFQDIFDALFRATSNERSTYFKSLASSSKASKSTAGTRLSNCASSLRQTVQVAVSNIKIKTVRAIIHHVLTFSLDPHGELCEPLALDFIKSLSLVLSYPAHVENLSTQEWEAVCSFCLGQIRNCSSLVEDATSGGASLRVLKQPSTQSSVRTSRSAVQLSQESSIGRALQKQLLGELVLCLRSMVSHPSAPLPGSCDDILTALLQLLDTSGSTNNTEIDALSAVNCVLRRIRTENVKLSERHTSHLVLTTRRFITAKSTPIKDEISIALVLMEPYIRRMTKRSMPSDDFFHDINGLAELLQNDYSRRAEKDQLRLEDLHLRFSGVADALTLPCFALRYGNAQAERDWTSVAVIVLFYQSQSDRDSEVARHNDLGDADSRQKRPRLIRWEDELLRMLKTPSASTRVCALQLLCFRLQLMPSTLEYMTQAIDSLSAHISDDNTTVAGWTLLAYACCAIQIGASNAVVVEHWITVWSIACRALNNPTTSRPAAHLLHILIRKELASRQQVTSLIQSFASSLDVNGPALFDDASSALLMNLVTQVRVARGTAGKDLPECALTWLFHKWDPGNSNDRLSLAHSVLLSSEDVLGLIRACVDTTHHLDTHPIYQRWYSLGQAWILRHETRNLIDYLLIQDMHVVPRFTSLGSEGIAAGSRHLTNGANTAVALRLCSEAIERCLSQNDSNEGVRPAQMTRDAIFTTAVLVHVGHCLSHDVEVHDKHRRTHLESSSDKLLALVNTQIQDKDCPEDKIDAVLNVFCVASAQAKSESVGQGNICHHSCVQRINTKFLRALESRRNVTLSDSPSLDDDFMDSDSEFDSQLVNTRASGRSDLLPRSMTAASCSLSARIAGATLYAKLMSCFYRTTTDEISASRVFVDFLITLSPDEIVAGSHILSRGPNYGLQLDSGEVSLLLEYLGTEVLQKYSLRTSEVTMDLVLDVMIQSVSQWTTASDPALHDLAVDIYDYFTGKALSAGALSAATLVRLGELLLRIWKQSPDFGQTEGMPSVRTILFKILREGQIEVKYYLAHRISLIFELFTIPNHDAVFEDLQANLPADADWIEGLALRICTLVQIGSRWHSLLRRSVYHIFEAAGKAPESAPYAASGLAQLSRALALETPRHLFQFFCPQLIYTWLSESHLQDLPYSVFGFDDLRQLLVYDTNEIFAQAVVFGKQEDVALCTQILKTKESDLVNTSISKMVAYAISQDVATAQQGNSSTACENRVRQLSPSKTEYINMIGRNVPLVVYQFLTSMQLDGGAEKAFGKHRPYSEAGTTLVDIKKLGSSSRSAPVTLQPSFRGRCLVDQLDRLCRRANLTLADVFNTPRLTACIRLLLNTIHPVLGSTHASSVLQRLRLLVALAGRPALQGYPLEMLLHALRPFLTQSQCAEDAIGILNYLYRGSGECLRESIQTITGNAVVTLFTLKYSMRSKQDITTQESHHRATISSMQQFHDWLATFLSTSKPLVPEKHQSRYETLVRSCRDTMSASYLTKSSPASHLLIAIMDDDASSSPLLNSIHRQEVLRHLLKSVEPPTSIKEDILADATAAAQYARCLWQLTRSLDLSPRVTAWIGRVLGRAYAEHGSAASMHFSSGKPDLGLLVDHPGGDNTSHGVIVNELLKMTFNDDPVQCSLAESTIRNVLAQSSDPNETIEFEQLLPVHVVVALKGFDMETAKAMAESAVLVSEGARLLSVQDLVKTDGPREWARDAARLVVKLSPAASILSKLSRLFTNVHTIAEVLFPRIVHIALDTESQDGGAVRSLIAELCTTAFDSHAPRTSHQSILLLDTLVYLLKQPIAHEQTHVDRQKWLDVDMQMAAATAARCGMPTTALFLIEMTGALVQETVGRASRRSSITTITAAAPSNELLLAILQNVDDPDSYYGVEQTPSFATVSNKLDHEQDGTRALMLHAAELDASLRSEGAEISRTPLGMIKALGVLNLNGLTYSLLSNKNDLTQTLDTDTLRNTARKLDQWDLAVPDDHASSSGILFSVLDSFRHATSLDSFQDTLVAASQRSIDILERSNVSVLSTNQLLRGLLLLNELDEVVQCQSAKELYSIFQTSEDARQRWDIGQFNESLEFSSYQESILGILRHNQHIRNILKVNAKDTCLLEARAILKSSSLARRHGTLQQSLNAATYLSGNLREYAELGLSINAATRFEEASVLWELSEVTPSVNILRDLCDRKDLEKQSIPVNRAVVLAQLGHQVASARLEKSADVIEHYLKPAIAHLHKSIKGSDAGRVFYEFATFCDQQLQDSNNLEDFRRLTTLRKHKEEETKQLEKLYHSLPATEKNARSDIAKSRQKAKMWFTLDDHEFKQVSATREQFVRQSLVNYFQTLQACDDHNGCVVRLFALWLEHADSDSVNEAISGYLKDVPSWKFIVLMNQIMSRLLQAVTPFQMLLAKLVARLCIDHPYHTIHHLFASCKVAVGEADQAARSRKAAADRIASGLRGDKRVGDMVKKVWEANELYHHLAATKVQNAGTPKQSIRSIATAYQMNKRVSELRIPPATLFLALRPASDYRHVPHIVRFRDEITIASGLSAPKILTARASDGNQYKQLFKGGNDDLRQDAIMEQVFGEVSKMLRNHRETRRRNLHIRTYKVLPLSSTSGIIEFVPNSMPFHDFVVPAHAKYNPGDMKWTEARGVIQNVQNGPRDQRVTAFRNVTKRYAPVLRHFFFERFEDPDEWFARRLAYTRSTAAISMLGYVLGLGDRHCHNILLDEKSGEVIHIDLGVAFEAGRVLPIPEVVPFRLSRDIVDGMGITKTEGVFRRCCEFTMEALRADKDSIMTLLNVLRYDPLYSWTVSPLRAKRMQEAQDESAGLAQLEQNGVSGTRNRDDEAGEAERALAVVEKKLSKTLSTAATVNELIQQATDDRNLAVLFAGWAAYS